MGKEPSYPCTLSAHTSVPFPNYEKVGDQTSTGSSKDAVTDVTKGNQRPGIQVLHGFTSESTSLSPSLCASWFFISTHSHGPTCVSLPMTHPLVSAVWASAPNPGYLTAPTPKCPPLNTAVSLFHRCSHVHTHTHTQ